MTLLRTVYFTPCGSTTYAATPPVVMVFRLRKIPYAVFFACVHARERRHTRTRNNTTLRESAGCSETAAKRLGYVSAG